MQNRSKRSNLELRGPKNGCKLGPRSSRGVRSAQFLVEIANPPMKWAIEGFRSHRISGKRAPIRNPPIRAILGSWRARS
eukprot:14735093-Alexandrium_andersonii.AAC.1